jgi:alkylation response protein AidB-like acyl-CoA dehydrogenase
MDFTFTEEQQQFADSLRRWAAKDYSFEARKAIVASAAGTSDRAWATLAELGMLALPVPLEQGGFGGNAIDMLLVMQEIGRSLIVEPYFATALGCRFLVLGGGHEGLLEKVAAGTVKLACALGEAQSGHELGDILTSAVAVAPGDPAAAAVAAVKASAAGRAMLPGADGDDGAGYMLDGSKTVVMHGAQADALIVSARSAGGQAGREGISLFVVPIGAHGVATQEYRTIDGQRAATVTLSRVALPKASLLGRAGAGWELLDAGADYGAALLCFEALGAMDALFGATLEYLKTRRQFGVPIGQFQVLQHRMADMFIHLEQARSMAMLAADTLAREDSCSDAASRVSGAGGRQRAAAGRDAAAAARRRIVSAAKVRTGQAIKFIGQQAIQLHGGMGVTNELPAAHHFKRLSMIEQSFGGTDYHLQRFMAQPAFTEIS